MQPPSTSVRAAASFDIVQQDQWCARVPCLPLQISAVTIASAQRSPSLVRSQMVAKQVWNVYEFRSAKAFRLV